MSQRLTKAQRQVLGTERMEVARRLLVMDRIENPWFEAASRVGRRGQYMEANWLARCRVAMHQNGLLLGTEANWVAFKNELDQWPSLLWMGLLNTEKLWASAKACYGSGSGKLALTTHTSDGVTIAPASWIPRNLRRSDSFEILEWVGAIGGELPPVERASNALGGNT